MKKLLYYSPLIPVVGIVIHLLWAMFYYDIVTVDAKVPMWATFAIMAYNGFVTGYILHNI